MSGKLFKRFRLVVGTSASCGLGFLLRSHAENDFGRDVGKNNAEEASVRIPTCLLIGI